MVFVHKLLSLPPASTLRAPLGALLAAALMVSAPALAQDAEMEDEIVEGDPDDVAPDEEKAPSKPEGTEGDPAQGDPAEGEDIAPLPESTEPPPLGDVAGVGPTLVPGKPGTEEVCDDGVDNDEDSMTDCADHDCHEAEACKPGGNENTGLFPPQSAPNPAIVETAGMDATRWWASRWLHSCGRRNHRRISG